MNKDRVIRELLDLIKESEDESVTTYKDETEEISNLRKQKHKGMAYAYNFALDRVDRLDAKEKVVVPQWFDDWYKTFENVDEVLKSKALYYLARAGWGYTFEDGNNEEFRFPNGESRVKNFNSFKGTVESSTLTFFRAILDGYEVEKEKRYHLRISTSLNIEYDEAYLNYLKLRGQYIIRNKKSVAGYQNIFTESELEDIDETGFVREEVNNDMEDK